MKKPIKTIVLSSALASQLCALDCTVTSADDSGVGTLRQCISDASSNDNILFEADTSITLFSEISFSNKNLSIDAEDHTVIIDGNNSTSLFDIDSSTLSLSNLTLKNATGAIRGVDSNLSILKSTVTGDSGTNRGAIYMSSFQETIHLTVEDANISNNTSTHIGGALTVNGDQNVTISNSTIDSNSAQFGGAIYTSSPFNPEDSQMLIELKDSNITNNSASYRGGAIHFYAKYTDNNDISIDNTNITNNTITASNSWNRAAGLYFFTDKSSNQTISIQNSIFSHNNSSSNGGSIHLDSQDDESLTHVSITDTSIMNNTSVDDNAALYIKAKEIEISDTNITHNVTQGDNIAKLDASLISINNTIVSDNNASNHSSLYIDNNETTNINTTIVSNNIATNKYSGLFIEGKASISNTTIDNNTASNKAGLTLTTPTALTSHIQSTTISNNTANDSMSGLILTQDARLVMQNATLSGNHDENFAGAITLDTTTGLSLNHVTITNNSSTKGMQAIGLIDSGTVDFNITNSIIAGNGEGFEFEDLESNGYNIFGSGTFYTTTLLSDHIDTEDPGLENLADNGGFTLTHSPLSTSIALSGANYTLSTDQRGEERKEGSTDIGAVEINDSKNLVPVIMFLLN